MSEVKLKPCPFCGSENLQEYFFDAPFYEQEMAEKYKVCCRVCVAEIEGWGKEEVIERWNCRVNPQTIHVEKSDTVKSQIDEVYALIDNGDFDKAKEGITALEQTIGDSHPELNKLITAYTFEKAVAESGTDEKQQWISVKDRLPDEDGKYLVTNSFPIKDGIAWLWIELCEFYKNGEDILESGLEDERNVFVDYIDEYGCYEVNQLVTHWMPLPELPSLV